MARRAKYAAQRREQLLRRGLLSSLLLLLLLLFLLLLLLLLLLLATAGRIATVPVFSPVSSQHAGRDTHIITRHGRRNGCGELRGSALFWPEREQVRFGALDLRGRCVWRGRRTVKV